MCLLVLSLKSQQTQLAVISLSGLLNSKVVRKAKSRSKIILPRVKIRSISGSFTWDLPTSFVEP